MRNWTIAAAGLAALATLTGCTATGTPAAAPVPASTTTSSTTTSSTTAATVDAVSTPSTSGSSTVTTGPAVRANATADLAGFVAAATSADARLRQAAAAVNANLKPTPAAVRPQTKQAVVAAQAAVDAAEDAIPVGLDRGLLTPAITVYSNLVARRDALSRYDSAITRPYPEWHDSLLCLGNGAAPARRFGTDLARLRTAAHRHTPVHLVSRASAAGAELALYVLDVKMDNGCAENCGGQVITKLQPVVWTRRPAPGKTAKGTIGNLEFSGVLRTNGRWQMEIQAC